MKCSFESWWYRRAVTPIREFQPLASNKPRHRLTTSTPGSKTSISTWTIMVEMPHETWSLTLRSYSKALTSISPSMKATLLPRSWCDPMLRPSSQIRSPAVDNTTFNIGTNLRTILSISPWTQVHLARARLLWAALLTSTVRHSW